MRHEERQSNIELLRIIAAVGVLILHYNSKRIGGGLLYVPEGTGRWLALNFLEGVFLCAVDLFMIIAGYFAYPKNSIRIGKLVRLIVAVSLTSMLLYIEGVIVNQVKLIPGEFWLSLIPDNFFVWTYIAVMIFSPFICLLLRKISSKSCIVLLILLVIFVCAWPFFTDYISALPNGTNLQAMNTVTRNGAIDGYTLTNYMFCFIIGASIRKLKPRVNKFIIICVLIGCWLLELQAMITLIPDKVIPEWLVMAYNNPVVVLTAVLSFLLFVNLKIPSNRVINEISSATFAVFLTHKGILMLSDIERYVQTNFRVMMLHILCVIVISFAVAYGLHLLFTFLWGFVERFIHIPEITVEEEH